MAKREKKAEGGSNWMDTYGDMVTLLLCFFVMLYSMSSVNAEKWEILVKSVNPNSDKVSQIVTGEKQNEAENPVQGSAKPAPTDVKNFEELYYTLTKYVEDNNLQENIVVEKGDGYTFLSFSNNVFFDGDSYYLRKEGKKILDNFAGMLSGISNSIGEIQIMGHTSQADPNKPNELVSDRFLASNRATEVLVYIQQKNVVDPSKLISSGFGQFRPISTFESKESRAKNRRVEIMITKSDVVANALQEYDQTSGTTEPPSGN